MRGNIHTVVQNASTGARTRGRPREYDHAEVVRSAIGAFFRTGFDATTLADLEAATGVDRSTLYNSFGGKSGLYREATDTYLALAASGLFAPLLEGTSDDYADVLRFLDDLQHGLTSTDVAPGCLIVNDMAAGADPEAARRYREMLEDGFGRALARAGEGDGARRSHRAALLATLVIGVNLVAKATGDAREVERQIDAIRSEVEGWAVA